MAAIPAAIILGVIGIVRDGQKAWAIIATALAGATLLLYVVVPLVVFLLRG